MSALHFHQSEWSVMTHQRIERKVLTNERLAYLSIAVLGVLGQPPARHPAAVPPHPHTLLQVRSKPEEICYFSHILVHIIVE